MRSSRSAALLIHGLGGTVYDLGTLGRTLEDANITVHTPLLPGHGTHPDDLLKTSWQDWVEAMVQEYRQLKTRYAKVHLAGVCLGGLVALEVARRETVSGKLALYAPPLYIDGWSLPKLTWLRHAVYRLPQLAQRMRVPENHPFGIKNPRLRNIIQQRFERGERFHYPYIPLACIREVDRLNRHLRRYIKQIHCTTLIVHSEEDDITSIRSAHYLRKHLPGPVEFMPLRNSYHMVLVDNDRQEVLNRSLRFFQTPTSKTEASTGWKSTRDNTTGPTELIAAS